jgi:phage regulator Rha-like protein
MASLQLPSTTLRFSGTAASAAPTMSSREIADLVEKRHDNVKRTIETLAERGVVTLPQIEETSFTDSAGKTQWVKAYRVGKRDGYVVVAQLSPEFTGRMVDRWQELESQLAPQMRSQALRLAADLAEQVEQQQAQIATMAPKAIALDRLIADDGMVLISDAAKLLDMPINELFDWLRANRWIFRRTGSKRDVAYADKLSAGLLKHRYYPVPQPDGTEALKARALLTRKGIARLAHIFSKTVI